MTRIYILSNCMACDKVKPINQDNLCMACDNDYKTACAPDNLQGKIEESEAVCVTH